MKSLIIIIVLSFVSLFATAQTSTGKFITVSGTQVEVFQGSRGGTYYINSKGNKTYTTPLQEAKIGITATTTNVSVPTPETAKIVSNGNTATGTDSKGRTLYTGSRGGVYYINANGNKTYVKN